MFQPLFSVVEKIGLIIVGNLQKKIRKINVLSSLIIPSTYHEKKIDICLSADVFKRVNC